MNGAAPDLELPILRFRLPGDWWRIPLVDRAEASASAMRLIRNRVGVQDERARLRNRLHRDFVTAIDEAINGHGQSLLLAIQIVQTVPLPITIAVYLPDVSMSPAIGTNGDRVLDILQLGLEGIDGRQLGGQRDVTRLELPGTMALRTSRIRSTTVGDGEDESVVEVFSVDYWLAVPGTKRIVLVNFSTSFAQLREYIQTFFDSIMRATYWQQPTTSQ